MYYDEETGCVEDDIYPDDGFRFSFEDMEKNGYKAYWVSLKLRTPRQKAVFNYVFDHPECVLGDLRETLNMGKDTLMPIIRGFMGRNLIMIVGDPNSRPRHYSINKETIDDLLECYKQRVFRQFPDVKVRYERNQRYKAEQERLRLEKEKRIAEELAKFEKHDETDENQDQNQDKPSAD